MEATRGTQAVGRSCTGSTHCSRRLEVRASTAFVGLAQGHPSHRDDSLARPRQGANHLEGGHSLRRCFEDTSHQNGVLELGDMDALLAQAARYSAGLALRSGISIAGGFAIRQVSNYIAKVPQNSNRQELELISKRLDQKIKVMELHLNSSGC